MYKKYSNILPMSALLALLYARLPGPATGEHADPSKEFWCESKGDGVVIATKAANLSWLFGVNGITMQKVTWVDSLKGWLSGKNDFALSTVNIEQVSRSEFLLKNLNTEIAQRLLSGEGRYAIVTVNRNETEGEYYKKMGDILVQGRGNGVWEILKQG